MTVTEKNQLFLKIIFCFFRFSIFAQFLRRPKAKSVKASNMAPSTEIVAVEDTPREEAPSTSVIAELSTSPTPLKDHPGGAPKGSEVSALSPPSFHITQSTRVPGLRRDWPLARDLRGGSLTPKRLPLCLLPFFGLKPRRAFLRCQRSRHGLELTLCTTQTCCTSRRSFF